MARKRLNKNLVLVLSFVAFATLLGVSALMLRKLQQRDPQYFVDLARQYEKSDDWATASVFYKKAWDRSRDSSYLVLLGDALLNTGEVEMAVASWRQALVNSPDLTDAHLRQIELFREMASLNGRASQWNMVKESAEAFLDSQAERTEAQAAFAHHVLGLALTNLANQDEGNAVRGEEELRIAMESAPGEVD